MLIQRLFHFKAFQEWFVLFVQEFTNDRVRSLLFLCNCSITSARDCYDSDSIDVLFDPVCEALMLIGKRRQLGEEEHCAIVRCDTMHKLLKWYQICVLVYLISVQAKRLLRLRWLGTVRIGGHRNIGISNRILLCPNLHHGCHLLDRLLRHALGTQLLSNGRILDSFVRCFLSLLNFRLKRLEFDCSFRALFHQVSDEVTAQYYLQHRNVILSIVVVQRRNILIDLTLDIITKAVQTDFNRLILSAARILRLRCSENPLETLGLQ